MTSPSIPLADRLWARVEITPTCWLWTGATAPMGWYGHLGYRGQNIAAHRLSWEIANGPVPEGMQVLHRCDVPRCVRPDHLFLGTALDNMGDASSKGRVHLGEANGIAKLTEDAVRKIRRDYRPGLRGELRRLARQYGVTDGAIRFVIRRETWRHVESAA